MASIITPTPTPTPMRIGVIFEFAFEGSVVSNMSTLPLNIISKK